MKILWNWKLVVGILVMFYMTLLIVIAGSVRQERLEVARGDGPEPYFYCDEFPNGWNCK